MKNIIVFIVLFLPSQLLFANKIDLSIWKEVATKKQSCPEGSIYYEETPAFGLRTIICHSLSVWPISILEKLSGEKVFISGPHKSGGLNLRSKTEFGHYNPRFIDWAINNLIPDYRDRDTQLWGGMYEGYLKPVFRALMKTYYDLEKNEDYRESEIAKYKAELFDQRGYYFKRWKKIKGNINADGSQMYAFWIRRYLDDSAIKLGSQLEKVLKTFDTKFLNQTRAEFGLENFTVLVKPYTLANKDLSKDFIKLGSIENSDEKIKFLKSIRFNYREPKQVSKILIKIGDLRPRITGVSGFKKKDFDSLGLVNGYFYDEISGNMLYTGAEYMEVIKLFPDTEFAEQASYKMLSIYQGGECEGELGCYVRAASSREIKFIRDYPRSKNIIKLAGQLGKLFDSSIKQIRMVEGNENYSQSDLQRALKQTLSRLMEATRNSTKDIKVFAIYYNGLFFLKTNDLVKAKKYFKDVLKFKGIEDNNFFKLAKERLSAFPPP